MGQTKSKTTKGKSTGRSTTKSSAKKSAAQPRSKGSAPVSRSQPRQTRQREPMDFPWMSELILFIVLAVCIMIYIGNAGKGGIIGGAFQTFFFGLFGVLSWVFPIWLFLIIAFIISNRKARGEVSARMIMKIVAAIILLVFVCTFAHLVSYFDSSIRIGDLYATCAKDHAGGGLLGGLLGIYFIKGFGMIGAFLLNILILVVAVVLLTEKEFFGSISRRLAPSVRRMQENRQIRRQEREAWLAEQEREDARAWANGDGPDEEEGLGGARRTSRSEARRQNSQRDPVRSNRSARSGRASAGSGQRRERESRRGVTMDTLLYDPEAQTLRPLTRDSFPDREEAPLSGKGDSGSRAEEGEKKVYAPPRIHITDQEPGLGFADDQADPAGSDSNKAGDRKNPVKDAERPEREGQTAGQKADGKEADPDAAYAAAAAVGAVAGAVAATGQEDKPARRQSSKNPVSSQEDNDAVSEEIDAANAAPPVREYVFPTTRALAKPDQSGGDSRKHLEAMSKRLQDTLQTFGVDAQVTDVICGPSVTRFEIHPEMGVKVSKIVNLADDIKLNLAVSDIRIEAPIPGKAAVGIEVPNKKSVTVTFRELIESKDFQDRDSRLTFCAGKDIGGKIILADIAKMPHVLIAGATGSGKSVCINTIIMSVLYKAKPEEVRMIMIDPKVVELSIYNGIPHLLLPVVTDPKKAAGALNWAVAEMTDRYRKFAEYQVKDIKAYNKKVDSVAHVDGEKPERMPQILIIVDELADLMMVAPGDVEGAICRLAQLARAAGIHLVIATQRPSVNVITGLIKANMPSRIAFAVTSGVDSRTILDMNGAEKLLGKGDMLFYPQDYQKPLRVQGAFISETEISDVVDEIKQKNGDTAYEESLQKKMEASSGGDSEQAPGKERDVYFDKAGFFVIEKEKGSIGMLQRMFKIGFNRAARIMDQLEEAGVVGPEEGTKPRQVLMSAEEFESYLQK